MAISVICHFGESLVIPSKSDKSFNLNCVKFYITFGSDFFISVKHYKLSNEFKFLLKNT